MKTYSWLSVLVSVMVGGSARADDSGGARSGADASDLPLDLSRAPERRDFIFSLMGVLWSQASMRLEPPVLERLLPERIFSPLDLGRRLSQIYNQNITVACSRKPTFEALARHLRAEKPLVLKIRPTENQGMWVTLTGFEKYAKGGILLVNDSRLGSGGTKLHLDQVTAYCGLNVSESTDSFARLAASVSAIITVSDDFREIPIVEQGDVAYQKAWRHKKKKFEIRIRVDPMAPLLAQKKQLEEKGGTMVDPNNHGPAFFKVMLLNIGGATGVRVGDFPAEGFCEEFNADSGMFGTAKGNSAFSKGYASVQAHYIQRNNVGTVYVFFLFDDREKVDKLIESNFYVARFSPVR